MCFLLPQIAKSPVVCGQSDIVQDDDSTTKKVHMFIIVVANVGVVNFFQCVMSSVVYFIHSLSMPLL